MSIPVAMPTASSTAIMALSASVLAANGIQLGTGSESWICAIPASRSSHTSSPA